MKFFLSAFLSAALGVLAALFIVATTGQAGESDSVLEARELLIVDENGDTAIRLSTLNGAGVVMVFQPGSGQPAAGLMSIPSDGISGAVAVYDAEGQTAAQLVSGSVVSGMTVQSANGQQAISAFVDNNKGLRSLYMTGDSGYPSLLMHVDANGIPEVGLLDPKTKQALWGAP